MSGQKNQDGSMKLDDFMGLQELERRTNKWMEIVVKKYPGIGFVTAIVMAGDYASAENADELIERGKLSVSEAIHLVGSFARLSWLVDKYKKGLLPKEWLLTDYPNEWVAADPDDTDPQFLELWRQAWIMNGCSIIRDGKDLPSDTGVLNIYRGQNSPVMDGGIAWTTDFDIAQRFANGMGARMKLNGVVMSAQISVSHVYGFMTGRGESEVVVNYSCLKNVKVYQSENKARKRR